jgi:hypothetical protein
MNSFDVLIKGLSTTKTFPVMGLVSYWNCEDQYDSVGTNDLTNYNSVVSNGINNNAIYGSPITSYSLLYSNEITISFWVYLDSSHANNVILILPYSGMLTVGCQFSSGMGDQTFQLLEHWGDYTPCDTYIVVTYGVWHNLVLTYDLTNGMRLYVDGVLGTTDSDVSLNCYDIFQTPMSIYVGVNTNEKTDEIGLWDRVLTTQEITDLYNGGTGIFPV